MNKRLVAWMLVLIISVITPLSTLANGRGGGTGINSGSVGVGSNPTVPNSAGIKVSVGPASVAIVDWAIPASYFNA